MKPAQNRSGLPVVTLAVKTAFEKSSDDRNQVAMDVAELLFGIVHAKGYLNQPRIFIPIQSNLPQ